MTPPNWISTFVSSDPRLQLGTELADSHPARVKDALDRTSLEIRVAPEMPNDARSAAAALHAMAATIYGHVAVVGRGSLGGCNPWELHDLRDLSDGRSIEPTLVVSFGNSRDADLYAGGGDWNVAISRSGPVLVESCRMGGLGLHAAAALCFGETLKLVLKPHGMVCAEVEQEFRWNLIDHGLRHHEEIPDGEATVVQLALLAAGSLGSSTAALLAGTPITGHAYVVDPDTFDPSRNAYRYPAATPATSGSKAEWAAGLLQHGHWTADAHPCSIAKWTSTRTAPGFEGIAVITGDRPEARAQAADLLARTNLSAGVAGLRFHVARHRAGSHSPCPYCDFVDLSDALSRTQMYAELSGLDIARVDELFAGDVLTAADLDQAVISGTVAADDRHALLGRRLEDLVRRRYAMATVACADTVQEDEVLVSAPHVSWLTGALLAAEVVKHAHALPAVDTRLDVDLAGLPLGVTSRPPPDRSGRCVCNTPARRYAIAQLYAA